MAAENDKGTKARAGRPTKYTRELGDMIIEGARAGLPLKTAAENARVPAKMAYKWLEAGENEDTKEPNPDLVDFAIRYREVAARFALQVHANILRSDDRRLMLRLLEISMPDTYAQITKHEITGKDGGPIKSEVTEVPLERMTTGELRKRLEELQTAKTPN